MKSLKLFPFLFLLAACTGGTPKYDATGTFEATEVIVSAEASGKLLSFDIEEGTTLIDGQEVGIIDTVQLYLKKLQLEASVKSVEGQRPDILKQVAATQEQIVQARRERDRVSNLLRVGAANQKQLDDAESLLEVLRKQLDAQNSTLRNSDRSLTWQSSSVGIQVAQIEDQLRKSPLRWREPSLPNMPKPESWLLPVPLFSKWRIWSRFTSVPTSPPNSLPKSSWGSK